MAIVKKWFADLDQLVQRHPTFGMLLVIFFSAGIFVITYRTGKEVGKLMYYMLH